MMDTLALEHGVTLRRVTPDDPDPHHMGVDYYVNRSFSIGRHEILLGTYTDPELLLISFFHEMGHCTYNGAPLNTQLTYEAAAWKQGLKLAEKHNVTFSAKALSWAFDQLISYESSK